MRNYIVNLFPTSLLIFISIIIALIISFLVYQLVSRYFPSTLLKYIQRDSNYHRIVTNGSTILLAFTVVVLFQNQLTAKNFVNDESSALQKIMINSRVFPEPQQKIIDAAVKNYTLIVVNEEWNLMRHEQYSQKASEALLNIYSDLQAYTPRNEKEVIFYRKIISELNKVHDDRYLRLSKLSSVIPIPFFTMLVICLFLLLFSTSMVEEKEKRTLAIYCLFVDVIIGLFFAIIITFDFPFAGDISISSQPFVDKVLTPL